MKNYLARLTRYVDEDMYKHSQEGGAARHAARELLGRWATLLKEGSSANFLTDVDSVIERFQQEGPHTYLDYYIGTVEWVVRPLQMFRFLAVRELPVVNGGLDGRGVAYWEKLLEKLNVKLHTLGDGRDRWTYSGAATDYEWQEEACQAAVAQYLR